jgi:L-amino acid N-acyltransferase YncA
MITYQLESWADYRRDVQDLWQEHYDELAMNKRKAMKPHEAFYMEAEKAGIMQLLTVRADGKLVGYCIMFIKPHPHYADVLVGFEDTYYLRKEYRKGMTGVRIITKSEKYCKDRGCREIVFMEIASKETASIFQHLKYKKSHTVWTKWIGE